MKMNPWRLKGHEARLMASGASLDLSQPALGVRGVPSGEAAVLGFTTQSPDAEPPRLIDVYTRGADVVAEYGPTENFPFRTEAYWRVESDQPLRLSLILSIETDLLDTRPELAVVSRIGGGSLQSEPEGLPGSLLARGDGDAWFEAIHPTDEGEAELLLEGETWRWRLFSRFLEKGVIRRARVLGAAIPSGAGRADSVEQIYQQFAAAPPPLTV